MQSVGRQIRKAAFDHAAVAAASMAQIHASAATSSSATNVGVAARAAATHVSVEASAAEEAAGPRTTQDDSALASTD